MKTIICIFALIFLGCNSLVNERVQICVPDSTGTCVCSFQSKQIDESCVTNWSNLNPSEKDLCRTQINNLGLRPQGNVTFPDNNWWEVLSSGYFDASQLSNYMTKYGTLSIVCTEQCTLINVPTNGPVCLNGTQPAYDSSRTTWSCPQTYGLIDSNKSIQLNDSQLTGAVQIYPYVCNGACNIQCPSDNLSCETKAVCLGYGTDGYGYTYPNCNY